MKEALMVSPTVVWKLAFHLLLQYNQVLMFLCDTFSRFNDLLRGRVTVK